MEIEAQRGHTANLIEHRIETKSLVSLYFAQTIDILPTMHKRMETFPGNTIAERHYPLSFLVLTGSVLRQNRTTVDQHRGRARSQRPDIVFEF